MRTVVARLHMLHYRFKTKGMWLDEFATPSEPVLELPGAADSPFAERLRESTKRQREQRRLVDYQIRAHVSPCPDVARHLAGMDRDVPQEIAILTQDLKRF